MRRLAALAVALVALSACTADDSSAPSTDSAPTSAAPTPTPTPAPAPPPAPVVGTCYRLSYDDAVAPTNADDPVPCKKPHTTQTFAVGTLDLVDQGHLLAVDSDAVKKQEAQQCPAELPAYVGGTEDQLRLSLLRPVWFTPDLEQADAGAAWFRCDVVALDGEQKVAKVDTDLTKVLATDAGREEFGMCGTAQPGTPTFSHVLCRDDHSWKAIKVIDLTGEAAKNGGYPGQDAVKAAGQDPCAEAARTIASDALDYQWGYEWPTRDQWDAGQTYGRCWSPDPP